MNRRAPARHWLSFSAVTGRKTLLWMIPLNLLLIAWVWFGRMAFGVGGWFLLIFAFSVVPVLLVALLISTILAYTQPGRPRHLTSTQRVAQWATWLGMFGFGLFCPDFGDTDDSHISALTQVFGTSDSALGLSYTLTGLAALCTVAAWIALVVTLVAGRRRVTA